MELDVWVVYGILKRNCICILVLCSFVPKRILIFQWYFKHVRVDVHRCFLALFFNIKATSAIVHDDGNRKLRTSSSQDLFNMLPCWDIELYRPKLSNSLPIEIWIKWLSFDSDDAAQVCGWDLIHITCYISDLIRPLSMCPVPCALNGHFETRIVWLLSLCVQNACLKQWFLKLCMSTPSLMLDSTLGLKLELEVIFAPVLHKRRRIFIQLFESASLQFRFQNFWQKLGSFVFYLAPVLVITKEVHSCICDKISKFYYYKLN